jgi:calcineurin-like phosphoesterase family protein/2'-5' RNA ligase
MDDTYLVEIRLARTRWRVKVITRAIAQTSGAERYQEQHPHVTLYGPFTLDDPRRLQFLLDTIGVIARTFGAIPFTIDGWERRDGMHGGVVAFSVCPSPALAELTATLARALSRFTVSLNGWDLQPDKKWFHVTIANRLPPGKSEEISSRLAAPEHEVHSRPADGSNITGLRTRILALVQRAGFLRRHHHGGPIQPVLLDDGGLRITVMHNEEILGEYDLLSHRWLKKEEIYDPRAWQQSMALYRQCAGFELSAPVVHGPDQIFLIADLHLGHANIIRYCSRPFVLSDVAEMDRVLIANWNYCVAPPDQVFFLGDLRYGRDARPEAEYRTLLNGNITFVAGNHDGNIRTAVPSALLACDGQEFILIHDPADAPIGFSGWIIHGHHHNNDLRAFPFINFAKKRINVSAEVVGYCPVSLQEICRIIRSQATGSGKSLLLRHPVLE